MNKNIFYTKEEVKDMDINRNALLLYLRDLRDLEIAKKKIIVIVWVWGVAGNIIITLLRFLRSCLNY